MLSSQEALCPMELANWTDWREKSKDGSKELEILVRRTWRNIVW
jgi:hypothetical protein